MEHTAKVLTSYEEQLNNAASILPAPAENICFFDIETTGLSAAVSSLYLIGTITFKNNEWVLNQWFADDYVSEASLCRRFLSFQKSTNGLRIIMVLPLTSLIWKEIPHKSYARPRLPGSRHLTFTGQSNTSKNISLFPTKN
ncbi:MAG: ribonuclease H-like domain-containing protein [Clostridium sp.]